MIHRLEAIVLFYKPYFLWSMAVTILIIIFSPYILTCITTKLLLTIFIWYYTNETSSKRKLVFYKNLGISTRELFLAVFLIDTLISITVLLIIKAFI